MVLHKIAAKVARAEGAHDATAFSMFDNKGSFRPAASHTIEECKRNTQRNSKAVEMCTIATASALKEGFVFDVVCVGDFALEALALYAGALEQLRRVGRCDDACT